MKYATIDDNQFRFENILNNHIKNMKEYFDLFFNVEKKVWEYLIQLDIKKPPLSIPIPSKNTVWVHADRNNKNSKIYDRFISGLFEKAHERLQLNYDDSMPNYYRKSSIDMSALNRASIDISYVSNPVIISLSFDQDCLKITYLINKDDNSQTMLTIMINPSNDIMTTELHPHGPMSAEIRLIPLSHTQLDYLIALVYYIASDEEISDVGHYVDGILNEDYNELLDYFKIKEMVYI